MMARTYGSASSESSGCLQGCGPFACSSAPSPRRSSRYDLPPPPPLSLTHSLTHSLRVAPPDANDGDQVVKEIALETDKTREGGGTSNVPRARHARVTCTSRACHVHVSARTNQAVAKFICLTEHAFPTLTPCPLLPPPFLHAPTSPLAPYLGPSISP